MEYRPLKFNNRSFQLIVLFNVKEYPLCYYLRWDRRQPQRCHNRELLVRYDDLDLHMLVPLHRTHLARTIRSAQTRHFWIYYFIGVWCGITTAQYWAGPIGFRTIWDGTIINNKLMWQTEIKSPAYYVQICHFSAIDLYLSFMVANRRGVEEQRGGLRGWCLPCLPSNIEAPWWYEAIIITNDTSNQWTSWTSWTSWT